MTKILYRPEIDGLRAVAVFAVILYHAKFSFFNVNLFEGGFLGVDIFFIISGYLITTLILKEIYQTNRFDFKNFYIKRIRRILPALYFVVIFSSILSYFILLPISLLDFGKSIFSVLLFFSNVYFWFTGSRYGAESELIRPLLHSWSLSVEEQFYILFPIFLIILTKFFRKNTLAVLFLFILASLLFSYYFSKFYPSLNFYIIFSRVFELLFGSLIAYLELNKPKSGGGGGGGYNKSYSLLYSLCPILGVIIIVYSSFFFNINKIFHPSFITLIPITGVCLIIFFSKKGEFITEILSSRFLVFFGLISYSLYLWHYPIFAYLRYIELFDNYIIKLLAVVLTILLSVISYYYVEKPFRNKKLISDKLLFFYIFLSFVILFGYSIYIISTKGLKDRFPRIISEALTMTPGSAPVFNQINNSRNVVLIGDSHADSLRYHLIKKLMAKNYNYHSFTNILYVEDFSFVDIKTGVVDKSFSDINNKITKFLNDNKKQVIILHYFWYNKLIVHNYEHTYFSANSPEERQRLLAKGLTLTVQNILKKDNYVIIVYPVPEMIVDVPRVVLSKYLSLSEKLLSRGKLNIDVPIVSIDYNLYKEKNKKVIEILDNIKGPNIYRIYPEKSFCNTIIKNVCVANSKEHLFYYDSNHLSLEGSRYVVNDIIKIIEKIEKKITE